CVLYCPAVGAPEVASICSRLRPNAQLVVGVSTADLALYTQVLRAAQCNHVFHVDNDAVLPAVTAIAGKLRTGDIFGIEKYLPGDANIKLSRLRNFEGRS